jgi:single-strand DNA-binding protein
MNKVMMIGTVVKDPEIKNATSGAGENFSIASLSIAVKKYKKVVEGQPDSDFFNLTAMGNTANVISKYVFKGHKIGINGYLENQTWDKPDGTKGYKQHIVLSEVELLTSKHESEKLAGVAVDVAKGGNNVVILKPDEMKLPEIDINDFNPQMPF